MTQTWGTATQSGGGGGGSSDPNVLKLGDSTRVRLLDAQGPRKWRQHNVRGEDLHDLFPSVDENAFRSIVCPRGADGIGSSPCPLDMKPSYRAADGKVKQLFPVSIRYAANVWDYESGTVKVLIGGKQIFADFDAVAQAGMDPTASDFLILKIGKGQQTSYKVVRGNSDPLPREIKPEDLHDLDKYEKPHTADRIFEVLGELGIDYDAIEIPTMTLDEANAFVMPYGKHKGLTIEQLFAVDSDYLKFIYGSRRDEGRYGDEVFIAMHAVLLDAGETTPVDDLPKAPPRAAVKPVPAAPAVDAPSAAPGPSAEVMAGDAVLLVAPGASEPQEFPSTAKAGLLAAGFTEYAEPEPERPPVLVGPGGNEIDASVMPDAAVAAMLRAGYRPKGAEVVYADGDEVTIDIGGTKASMPYGQAKQLIGSGTATLVEA